MERKKRTNENKLQKALELKTRTEYKIKEYQMIKSLMSTDIYQL